MFKILSRFSILMISVFMAMFLAWKLGHRIEDLNINNIRLQLGYLGAMLLFVSMIYSVRKRWRKGPGKLADWLLMHEYFAVAGSILIIVHSGSLYYAKLPSVATGMMLIVTVSGFVGRYLHREVVQKKKEHPLNEILANSPIRFWRPVHIQLTGVMGAAVVAHIITAVYFGGLS